MQWWTRQQLISRDPERRKAALGRLAEHPTPDAEAVAVRALEDPDASVRVAAVEVLVQLPPERAISCLLRAAGNMEPGVRERSIRALGGMKNGELIEPLIPCLRDSHDAVRTAAARALEGLGWKPTEDSDLASLAVAGHDFNTAVQQGAAAIEPLLVVLADPTYTNRRAVVLALAEIGDVRTTKALVSAARDPDPSVRVVAFEALGELNEGAGLEAVRLGLRDTNPNVRAAAAESLGRLMDSESVEALVAAVKDVHWSVRKAVLEALGRLQDPRALSPLVGRLSDTDQDVRMAAVEALGQLHCGEAIEALVGVLIDPHAPVRRAAENALRRLDARWEQSAAAQAVTPRLKAAMNTNDYLVRQAAANVLLKIGAALAVDRTPAALSHAALHRRQASLEVFLACLEDTDRDLRLAAVEALGRILEPASQAAISSLAADPGEDPWVRTAAQGILPRLAGARGGGGLARLAEPDPQKIVKLSLWQGEEKQRSRQ